MKRVSWKYLAGLIDGEGCIDVQGSKVPGYPDNLYIRPRLRICMADSAKDLLETFQLNFGGHICTRELNLKNPAWQNASSWEATGYGPACSVLRNVVNHLILKREQSRLCLWMNEHIKGRQVHQKVRNLIRDELSLMKRDPHRLSEMAQTRVWEAIVEKPEILLESMT